MPARRWPWFCAVLLVVVGLALVIVGAGRILSSRSLSPAGAIPGPSDIERRPAASATEPILPPPPTAMPLARATAAGTPGAALGPGVGPTGPTESGPGEGIYSLRRRLGLAASGASVDEALAERLGMGWYLDWGAWTDRFRSAGVEYVPMIRLRGGRPEPDEATLLAVIDARPGSLWLIGNEPDVKWQDNLTPQEYARHYHDLYGLLKATDPTCQVAIGGVAQPTPLRLQYLDLVLEAYRARYGVPMPVDVWNVHNFVLREERDSWGVDIPPGMEDRAGVLREIADHDSLAIFRQQIVEFRRWMKAHGQQNKPLIVSEYGILMPSEYGFPVDRVERFMLDTFEFFRSATDPELGYPADGFRLVQRWCWYSLADDRYPTGNLLDLQSGELTSLGRAFRSYASSSSE